MQVIKGKKVLIGVSGGIAVYKAVALCSKLVQAGAHVRVIMTESATKFVTPLTFQVMSRSRVATDTFAEEEPSVVAHIDWADWADLVIVAPATANVIAKMAHGIADDMLTTTLLATQAPVVVAPAMNVHMYDHPAVKANIAALQARGVSFIEPGEGQLACGYVGKGRLAEPEQMFAWIVERFTMNRPLAGKRVLVTAGGTFERIDPVRFIGNDSSGKMGLAIASAAVHMGAAVTLVAANVKLPMPSGVDIVHVISAQDMHDAVMERFDEMDIVIKAAAVADYRPVQRAEQKLKKTDDRLVIELERTEDILYRLGQRKGRQFLVGFAAETNDVAANAADKLRRKNCDLLIANDVSKPGIGFGADDNAALVFGPEGLLCEYEAMPKRALADALLRLIVQRMEKARGVDA